MAPEVLGSLISAGGSLLGSGLSQGLNVLNMNRQVQASKDLMDYQWQNFNSPAAQLRSLKEIGLGVNAFVNGKGSSATPTGGMPSSAPISFDGIADLGNISAYIQSVANAKKAGMDTKLSEQEIKNKEIQRQRDEFELQLRKQFGKDINSAELANAYMQLVLAADQSDLNEQEKAINEYKKLAEKAISDANESQAGILRQNLENNPTVIKLENSLREEKIKSEKAGQAASSAMASHYSALVKTEDALRDLKVSSSVLENGLKALEFEYNQDTLKDRVSKVAQELGVVRWTALMSELEYKDRNAYTAIQRLMYGKSLKGDVGIVLKALKNYEELNVPK